MSDPIFRKIPTHRIRPNPNQPRRVISPGAVEAMKASLLAVGQQTTAKVRDLTKTERVADPDHDVELIGGHIRHAGALAAEIPTLDCVVYDLTPEQVELSALLDNQSTDMHWLDWIVAIEKRYNAQTEKSQRKIAAELGLSQTRVNFTLKLAEALNPASRKLIDYDVITSGPENAVLERPVIALAGLDDPQQVEKALPVLIRLKLTELQAKALVGHVKAGNPPETFTGHKAPTPPKAKKAPGITPEVADKLIGLGKQLGAAEARGEDTQPVQEQITAYLVEIKTASLPVAPPLSYPITSPEGFALLRQAGEKLKAWFKPGPTESSQLPSVAEGVSVQTTPEPEVSQAAAKTPIANGNNNGPLAQPNLAPQLVVSAQVPENFFLDWLAGISAIKQIRKKVEKREPLTKGEIVLLVADKAGVVFGWLIKVLLKVVIGIFKLGWKLMKETYKSLAEVMPKKGKLGKFFKTAKLVLLIAFWGVVIWLILDVRQNGIWHPLNLIRYKFHLFASNKDSQPQETPSTVPTPAPQSILPKVEAVVSHLAPEKKIEKPTPVAAYQPAVSFVPLASSTQTLYDPKILESEILSLPQNCIVKDYPMTPDEGIPGDLAVSRMQDMTDPDKYTMMIGGGKQILLSINATPTNLTIHFKSADPLGFLDNGGLMNIFWEDVIYIHTNEVDVETKTPSTIYQCSLVVSGAKKPLTIQCSRPEDMEHLVSTMEYFIRSSRLGHDTALAGMPYPTQGLVLNNDGVVEKLWADSPMDKAGIQLGDHLWSIGKVTSEKQSRNDLEAGLKSLPVTFFAASPSEWTRALIARGPSQANSFSPKLRKVSLGQ